MQIDKCIELWKPLWKLGDKYGSVIVLGRYIVSIDAYSPARYRGYFKDDRDCVKQMLKQAKRYGDKITLKNTEELYSHYGK